MCRIHQNGGILSPYHLVVDLKQSSDWGSYAGLVAGLAFEQLYI
jgi:hypothetical protein